MTVWWNYSVMCLETSHSFWHYVIFSLFASSAGCWEMQGIHFFTWAYHWECFLIMATCVESVSPDISLIWSLQMMHFMCFVTTVNICIIIFTLSIGAPYLLTILVLKFEMSILLPMDVSIVCMANSVDPDQMLHSAASDLGLHCLQWPICPNT